MSRPFRRILLLALSLLAILHLSTLFRLTTPSPYPSTSPHPLPPQPIGRVFIAANFWNAAQILPFWSTSLLSLIDRLGAGNVFVSVYESGSWDNTKQHLQALDAALEQQGVRRRILLEDRTHKSFITNPPASGEEREGWVHTPDGGMGFRRIPFLAALRNMVLEPLREKGVRYDRILFLNDVVFTPEDALNLLHTRNGDYAAACALDFNHAPDFYDTFALRDMAGRPPTSQNYPLFAPGASRQAMLRGEPVPVKSCWNGMTAFNAAPFLGERGLRFRGLEDSLAQLHVEASECCLVHYDNPFTARQGVWVNPAVRVGYNKEAWERMREWPGKREWRGTVWSWVRGLGMWGNWKVEGRVERWERETGRREGGRGCVVDEMQVLRGNGWAHV